MFEVCPKIEDNCALCGKGTYNPHEQRYDDIERLFCGAAPPSYDTKVESLPKCPLKMDKREMTKYRKDKKEEWEKVMKLDGKAQVKFWEDKGEKRVKPKNKITRFIKKDN